MKEHAHSTNNSDYNMVGTIAGISDGTIAGCHVMNGSITVNLYNSQVGGIVGSTLGGKIYECTNDSVDVSGFGILGGIVGVNSLNVTIQSCTNKANITYSFDTESGCAGGIAGKNTLNGIITNCINEGTIGYGGERETNPHNRPCMAQIIGWNQQGTVEGGSCNGHTDFNHMTLGQKKYCSNKAVGKTGD